MSVVFEAKNPGTIAVKIMSDDNGSVNIAIMDDDVDFIIASLEPDGKLHLWNIGDIDPDLGIIIKEGFIEIVRE